ncbi:hypothetical protein [Methylomonas rapida]|uniref:Uncharacterized protein n=1 Tax=Methylomonas rapida TaxID=2963939 RepID=A0ABY7GQ10_9GAMM|nr:hypothetical protein [Methylomonas rapida]WAR46571.1 hypothetical protein NM686_008665 [Methylomonas rapida]
MKKHLFGDLIYQLVGKILGAILLMVCIVGQAGAVDDMALKKAFLAALVPASDEELAELRGGFVLPNGMNVEFSVEKIVSMNGMITFSSTFNMPANISLIQNGLGNEAPEFQGPVLGSVVQNNLDDQFISTLKTINIELSNLRNSITPAQRALVASDLAVPNVNR